MAAVASAARRIGFFFAPGIKEANSTGDCVWENGSRVLAAERTQTPNTNWDGSVRTSNGDRKKPDVFKHAVFKLRCEKRQLKCVRKLD